MTALDHDNTCPICMTVYRLPIYCCPNRHPICANCCQRVKECPMCRCPYAKPIQRFEQLEERLLLARYPCPNDPIRCYEQFTYHELIRHRNTCPNALTLCPVADEYQCTRRGRRHDIFQHVINDHRFASTYEKSIAFLFVKEMGEATIIFHDANCVLYLVHERLPDNRNSLEFHAVQIESENAEQIDAKIKILVDRMVYEFVLNEVHSIICHERVREVTLFIAK